MVTVLSAFRVVVVVDDGCPWRVGLHNGNVVDFIVSLVSLVSLSVQLLAGEREEPREPGQPSEPGPRR